MKTQRKPQLGTISHATLRSCDLIEAFADELRYLDHEAYLEILNDWRDCMPHTGGEDYLAEMNLEAWCDSRIDTEDPCYLIEELSDALNDLAPDFCYFGAHEGDGSDFGFWPCWEAIDDATHDGEILRVDHLSEIPTGHSGYVLHVPVIGIVELYHADETGQYKSIWRIV